jgi:hypothetical protein
VVDSAGVSLKVGDGDSPATHAFNENNQPAVAALIPSAAMRLMNSRRLSPLTSPLLSEGLSLVFWSDI